MSVKIHHNNLTAAASKNNFTVHHQIKLSGLPESILDTSIKNHTAVCDCTLPPYVLHLRCPGGNMVLLMLWVESAPRHIHIAGHCLANGRK